MPQEPPEPVAPGAVPPDATPPENHAAVWLAEEWGRQVTRAVESMTGEPTRITFAPRQLAPAEVDPSQQELLWWEQPLSLGPDANIWVAASRRQLAGNRQSSAAQRGSGRRHPRRHPQHLPRDRQPEPLRGGERSLHQARKEISCLEGRSAAPPAAFPGASAFAFEITLGEQAFPLLAVFAPAIANLSDAPAQAPAKAAPEERTPAAGAAAKAGTSGSIDLLLDVELPVIVSFGRAQLMLKDVIKLTTGSIVELNRALSEPVEVIVNNCVIARGEVVVVEGNYGIRIKQVISRQERLRTLY